MSQLFCRDLPDEHLQRNYQETSAADESGQSVRVPRFPLPRLMTSYLLYDVKLHNEKNNVMSDVTKEGEGTTM